MSDEEAKVCPVCGEELSSIVDICSGKTTYFCKGGICQPFHYKREE